MMSSSTYGVSLEQLRYDIINTAQNYFEGRDWFNVNLLRNVIVRIVDDKEFRRKDGREGWMYVFIYEDGAIFHDYNVFDHFRVNDKLVFRWDVCGNDKFIVKKFDYSQDVRVSK